MFALAVLLVASLDADSAFAEGRNLYDDLEYEQAVFRFQECALRAGVAGPDRASALVWLGLSYAGTGDEEAARRAFVDAVRAHAALVLPIEVSPRLTQLFEDAKRFVASTAAPEPAAPGKGQPAPPPSAPVDDNTPIVAGVATATGAVLVVAGIGLAVLSAVSFGAASDRSATQIGAKAALDAANLELAGASVLIPLGAVVAAVSGFMLLGDQGAATKSTAGRATAPDVTSTVFFTSWPL